MPTLAFVGLDVAQDDASVCFLLSDGKEPVPSWIIPNTQPGADALATTLAHLAQTYLLINCASGWRPPACSGGTWPAPSRTRRRLLRSRHAFPRSTRT